MSKHVWQVGRFSPTTVELGVSGVREALARGATFALAVRFGGYLMETVRQKGGVDNGRFTALLEDDRKQTFHHWNPDDTDAQNLWETVVRGKHRFARGRNGKNYEDAGRRAVCDYLRLNFSDWSPASTGLYTALFDGDLTAAGPLSDLLEEAGADPASVSLLRERPASTGGGRNELPESPRVTQRRWKRAENPGGTAKAECRR